MPSRSAQLRLFVASYPPEPAAAWMRSLLDRLRLDEHRPTPVEQIHLTLQFIGSVAARDLEDVRESVSRSCSGIGRFALTPRRLISLPRTGRPRLVALETDAPGELMELKRRLARRLARHPRARDEGRFVPHLTLCRFAHGADAAGVDLEVEGEPFAVDRARLMRSVLLPGGARHDEVASFALAGPDR